MFRHGDVLLIPTTEIPANATRTERDDRGVVLAEGEATGHAHAIKNREVWLWEANGRRYIEVGEPATLTHEEHGSISLAPGYYEVIRQRVYTAEELRYVID